MKGITKEGETVSVIAVISKNKRKRGIVMAHTGHKHKPNTRHVKLIED